MAYNDQELSIWGLSCVPAFPSSVPMASSFDGCRQRTFLTFTGYSTLAPTPTWQHGAVLFFTLHKPHRRRARPTIAAVRPPSFVPASSPRPIRPTGRLAEGCLRYCKCSGMQQMDLEMDIRKWLAETENPISSEHPISSEQPEIGRFLLPRQPDAVLNARRRRKRSSSDSSLLKAASPQPRRKGVTAKKLDCWEDPDVTDDDHNDTSHSTSGGSTCSAASQRYARKPRRKTRADKYDVRSKKAKAQDEGQRASRKSESRKSKRKSRRKKDEKTHNGIGQEFQARNVSKERLTVRTAYYT